MFPLVIAVSVVTSNIEVDETFVNTEVACDEEVVVITIGVDTLFIEEVVVALIVIVVIVVAVVVKIFDV